MKKEVYTKTEDFVDEIKKAACDRVFVDMSQSQQDAQDENGVDCKHVFSFLQLTSCSPEAHYIHVLPIGDAMIATQEEFETFKTGCLSKRTEIINQIQRFAPKCKIFEGATSPVPNLLYTKE